MPSLMNNQARRPSPTRDLLWWLALVVSVVGLLTIATLLFMPTQ